MTDSYRGILCIGDPHLASRVPGFRKDDYPHVILEKLRWALDYARRESLAPMVLGDFFHYPRDNDTWLLVELCLLFENPVWGVAGNHDVRENDLGADDTLAVLVAAGKVRLLDQNGPWRGTMNGRHVVIGGTAWGKRLPKEFERTPHTSLVVWIAHHDICFPGYEESGRFQATEIPGIDIVVNGHIHRPLETVVAGRTTWINPGNVARVSRSDSSRQRQPAVLRLDVFPDRWEQSMVPVPCEPFDAVFHEELLATGLPADESGFVRGLAELECLKTATGAGLREFLDDNLDQFTTPVAAEIRELAQEVLDDEST